MVNRRRLFVEWLESRDNPSVPGGDVPPYTPPPPSSDPPVQVEPPPETSIIEEGADSLVFIPVTPPAHRNGITGQTTLPYVGP
jgi:hypothetical protein